MSHAPTMKPSIARKILSSVQANDVEWDALRSEQKQRIIVAGLDHKYRLQSKTKKTFGNCFYDYLRRQSKKTMAGDFDGSRAIVSRNQNFGR